MALMHGSGWTIYVSIGPFMFWHKWPGGTIYDNISGLGGPIMSNINGPSGALMYARTIYAVTGLLSLL